MGINKRKSFTSFLCCHLEILSRCYINAHTNFKSLVHSDDDGVVILGYGDPQLSDLDDTGWSTQTMLFIILFSRIPCKLKL